MIENCASHAIFELSKFIESKCKMRVESKHTLEIFHFAFFILWGDET